MAAGEGEGHPGSAPDPAGKRRDSERRRRQAAPPGLPGRVQTETGRARQPHSGTLRKGEFNEV